MLLAKCSMSAKDALMLMARMHDDAALCLMMHDDAALILFGGIDALIQYLDAAKFSGTEGIFRGHVWTPTIDFPFLSGYQ